MAISGWIIRKVGYHGCMLMCLLSFGIRFLGYYLMVNPWFVLLIDVVHSVGYGLFYASMTNFAFEKLQRSYRHVAGRAGGHVRRIWENVFSLASESSVNPSPLVQWTHQFWLTGLLLAVGWFGYGAAVTLNDAIAFSVVESSPVKTTYGANRVLGTMGWASFALLIGLLLQTFSDSAAAEDRDFTPAFATFAVAAVLAFGATFFLRAPKPVEIPPPLVKAVGRSLWTVDVMLFRYVAKVPWDGMSPGTECHSGRNVARNGTSSGRNVTWDGTSPGTERRQERNVAGTKCRLGRNVAWDGTSPGTERRLSSSSHGTGKL
ncbi:hypothetical protein BV898_13543 [Hypsibius exemplaris]|uniref:Major facilitator superfamily associated domain-containing protein n=1 Tax=Hypsibius exemplaris TaxID=2072580 RepID=A0A1W0WAI1_HYPEX|nr:hypothetical protein BV898_13543 [Hypsibius exemplaris]